jgi:hypothetical protein
MDEIPIGLRELFAKAPVLLTESADQYWAMFNLFAGEFKPRDAIDWLLLKDICDYSWEALRMRRLKVSAQDIEMKNALAGLLRRIEMYTKNPVPPIDELSAGYWSDPKTRATVRQLLQNAGLEEHSISAQAFRTSVNLIEKMYIMENCASARRDNLIAQFERRHEQSGSPREMPIIDAEAIEVPKATKRRIRDNRKRPAPAKKPEEQEDDEEWIDPAMLAIGER